MALMCSPVKNRGPASWHRDIDPVHQAPLNGIQMDMIDRKRAGCTYSGTSLSMTMMYFGWCQVAIVVPTQWRNNSLTHSQQPISGGIPVELKAGDGVVYTHIIFHWGSN